MSVGDYKKVKNLLRLINKVKNYLEPYVVNQGKLLEKIGDNHAKIWNHPITQEAAGIFGEVAGTASMIPGAAFVGEHGAKIGAGINADMGLLLSDVGKALQGNKTWKEIGSDIINYIPNKIRDTNIYKVLDGQMNWRDGVLNMLENEAHLSFLAPNKVHAWKDSQGNYHRNYVPGSTMVVGEWQNNPYANNTPLSDNGKVIGVTPNGEVIRSPENSLPPINIINDPSSNGVNRPLKK